MSQGLSDATSTSTSCRLTQADNQENESQSAPGTNLSAASAPANPVFALLVISCLLMAKPQVTAVVPPARGGPSTERLIVPVPG